jgi:hypothetical protein
MTFTIEMDLSKTISYLEGKYSAKIETNTITYSGSAKSVDIINNQKSTATITTKSGSKDVTTAAVLNTSTAATASIIEVGATKTQSLSSRLELAGVTELHFQFYKDNIATALNEENIIKQILYLFEESNSPSVGNYKNIKYLTDAGDVIVENLPASTDVVKPVTQRVTNLDNYLRDVQRT